MYEIGIKIQEVYCVMLQKSCIVYISTMFDQNIWSPDTKRFDRARNVLMRLTNGTCFGYRGSEQNKQTQLLLSEHSEHIFEHTRKTLYICDIWTVFCF